MLIKDASGALIYPHEMVDLLNAMPSESGLSMSQFASKADYEAAVAQSAELPPIPTKRKNEDRSDWYGSGYVDGWNACVDRMRVSTPQSASVSISAHEEALVELNLLRSQTRELAERCRPAVAHDARLRERDVDSDKYAHTYKPVLKAEAERAAKLLYDIDTILGARSVAPHRSGGPIADGTPKPEHASPDSRSAK